MLAREQRVDRSVVQHRGARPVALGVRLYRPQGSLDLSHGLSALHVPTVPPAVIGSFLFVMATLTVLVAATPLAPATGSRVDMGQVRLAGLRQTINVELDPDPAVDLAERGGAAHARVAHQFERNLGERDVPGVRHVVHQPDLLPLRRDYGLCELAHLRAVGAFEYGLGHRYGAPVVPDHKPQELRVGFVGRRLC
jgi:hypothetical protein